MVNFAKLFALRSRSPKEMTGWNFVASSRTHVRDVPETMSEVRQRGCAFGARLLPHRRGGIICFF